ncbi:MAG: amino acid ABC transporter permease [Firmicutes bacterium]|jgi:polar amino acid transport system permease protein|nr:amino acid ABC transporter permease [Bacillota bacterium]MBR6503817.1 amino acid ABC transporter permease [Bacillota bacterium]
MSLSIMLSQLSVGMVRAVGIFALTLLFSLPLGMLVAFARMSKNGIIKNIARVYISVLRGTPLMLQLLVVYFAPFYLWHANIGGYRFAAVILGFTLNYAAYFAEIYRGGIQSVPQGQYEAAQVLGYSKSQTFFRIVLPQVVKNILPAVTNEVITLVKDTSLAFALAYQEVFTLAKQIAAAQTNFIPFVVAGIFYYVFNVLVAFVMERIEHKMDYYR